MKIKSFAAKTLHLEEMDMYRFDKNHQFHFTDFNQPMGLKMNQENRWVKKAETIPWEAIEEKYAALDGKNFTAREELEFYIDCYIDLYKNHKDLLKFNRNFDIYVIEEKPSVEEMKIYYDAVNFFKRKFHVVFAKASSDKSIRTDIPEDRVFLGIMHSMLSSAAKYACGIIYPPDDNSDNTSELELQKSAYMRYMTDDV